MSSSDQTEVSEPDTVFTAETLGLRLGLGDPDKPGTARKAVNVRISRGQDMPPSIRISDLKARLWRASTVDRWLAVREAPTRTATQKARGGRPRKADQLAMAAIHKSAAR